jgi:hypothetical protein
MNMTTDQGRYEPKEWPPVKCMTCEQNGFPNVLIKLDGKDAKGYWIKKEVDGTPHKHFKKGTPVGLQQQQQQATVPQTETTTTITDASQMSTILAKIVENNQDIFDYLKETSKEYRDLKQNIYSLDAKIDRLLAILTTHTEPPADFDPEEQKKADAEAQYDQDKEDGLI